MATGPRTSQIAQTGATTNQAIVWDGTKWTPTTLSAILAAPLVDRASGNPVVNNDGSDYVYAN